MRRGRLLWYWILPMNNFSWLEFTWLRSWRLGLWSLTDGSRPQICSRCPNGWTAVQTRWQTWKFWKYGFDLGDLNHLSLHLEQKWKKGNNIKVIMMVTGLILTPWVPRGVLLLTFFLKKQVGTEKPDHPNRGYLSSTGTLQYVIFHQQIMQQQVLGKSCFISFFFFTCEHCLGSQLCSHSLYVSH